MICEIRNIMVLNVIGVTTFFHISKLHIMISDIKNIVSGQFMLMPMYQRGIPIDLSNCVRRKGQPSTFEFIALYVLCTCHPFTETCDNGNIFTNK